MSRHIETHTMLSGDLEKDETLLEIWNAVKVGHYYNLEPCSSHF
jgi:hypothetical protein